MAGPDLLANTDLGDVLDDLTTGSNIHPGIHQITAGIRAIATDPHIDRPALQLLLAQLVGEAGGVTVVAAIGHLIERLTTCTPVVQTLDEDTQKTLAHQGWLAQYLLTNPELADPAATVSAALDPRREVPAVTRLNDDERKKLSEKNHEKNKQSRNPYPK